MRDTLKHAKGLGLILTPPPCNASKEACPSYHIKGLCNTRCRRAGDNIPYPPEGDLTLISWSNKVILGEEEVSVNDSASQRQALETIRPEEGVSPPSHLGWKYHPDT